MGGVTSTAVMATHRRKGCCGIMTAMLTDCREHGESWSAERE